MNWLYYLAEANLYLCVFYVAYCVFLAKETHYQLNRAYLLISCAMSFVLPVLQLGALRPQLSENTPTIVYTVTQPLQSLAPSSGVKLPADVATPALGIDDYLWIAYMAGAVILLLMLALKLYSVFKLTRNNKVGYGSYQMVYLKDTDVAFSFFNYLFIGTRADGAHTIITHELVHIRQKHSADIMFLELLKVICWFNPCIYLLQESLKTVHEYIADEQTAATETDALTYSSFLVNNAYGAGGSSITHSFFNYNLLKKRIIMLNQQRSGKLARLKYLVALPVCAGLLCASTLAFSKSYGWIDLSSVTDVHSATTPVKPTALPVDTLTTNKGYKYTEAFYKKNGYTTCSVTFYEADGSKTRFTSAPISENIVKILKDKYGYQFPKGTVPPSPPPMAPKSKTDIVKFPPPVVKPKGNVSKLSPPPPEPPKPKVDRVKFPPKVKMDQVKFPPPVVKPDASNTVTGQVKVTSKGYTYEEGAFIADKKGDMFVIIYEKNEGNLPIYRSSATAEQIKMLRDKYGYKFPSLKVFSEMPPPPPPMPPVAKPDKPTSSLFNIKNSKGGAIAKTSFNNVIIDPQNGTANRVNPVPLIVVNNKPVTLSDQQKEMLKSGSNLSVSASDSLRSYQPNNSYAIANWGNEAAKGVIALYGKTSITIVN